MPNIKLLMTWNIKYYFITLTHEQDDKYHLSELRNIFFFVLNYVWIQFKLSSEQYHVYEMTKRPVRLNVFIKYVSFSVKWV